MHEKLTREPAGNGSPCPQLCSRPDLRHVSLAAADIVTLTTACQTSESRESENADPAPVMIISRFIRPGRSRTIGISIRRGGSVGSLAKTQGCSKRENREQGK